MTRPTLRMATLGDIVIGLRMNHAQFSAGAQQVRSEVGGLGSIASAVGGKLLGFAAAATAGLTVMGAARWGVEVAAQSEMAQASFTTLLGSADAAKSMLVGLTQYAAKTPYSQGGIRDAAQTLLNFGVNAKSVIPDLAMLGDVAMGSEEKLGRISLAYGQIASTGRLMGQDLLQLINSGFNPLQEISARTGESMAALKKRMEDGKISFDEVRQAFVDATSAGGRFHNMAATQSKTLTGLWSNLKDEVGLALGGLATYMLEAFNVKGWMQAAIDAVQFIRSNLPGGPNRRAGPLDEFDRQLPREGSGLFDNLDRRSRNQEIRRKNREDPFGFAGMGDDLKKWTAALDRHSEAMGKMLFKKGTAENPGLHGGIGGLFFDEKGGNYVSGNDAAVAADQAARAKKDWDDRSKMRDRERRAGVRGAGAITAGSSEFFKALFAASGNQQADRQYKLAYKQLSEAKRAADEAARLNRNLENNEIAAVGVR